MQENIIEKNDTVKDGDDTTEATLLAIIKETCETYYKEKKAIDPNYEPVDPSEEEKDFINKFLKNELKINNVPFPETGFQKQVEKLKKSNAVFPYDTQK